MCSWSASELAQGQMPMPWVQCLMAASMLSGGVLTLLAAFTNDYTQLLILRALLGFMLGGMPAVAMALEDVRVPA